MQDHRTIKPGQQPRGVSESEINALLDELEALEEPPEQSLDTHYDADALCIGASIPSEGMSFALEL